MSSKVIALRSATPLPELATNINDGHARAVAKLGAFGNVLRSRPLASRSQATSKARRMDQVV